MFRINLYMYMGELAKPRCAIHHHLTVKALTYLYINQESNFFFEIIINAIHKIKWIKN